MTDEERYRRQEDVFELILDLRKQLRDLDVVLRGERGHSGLVAEYRRHDEILTRIYAILWQDPTGQKGLLHDIDVLRGRKSDNEKVAQARWQFWTAILVALITSTTALVTNWETIKKYIPKDHPDQVSRMIEKAKHPKSQKKIYRVRRVPAPATGETTLPEQDPLK